MLSIEVSPTGVRERAVVSQDHQCERCSQIIDRKVATALDRRDWAAFQAFPCCLNLCHDEILTVWESVIDRRGTRMVISLESTNFARLCWSLVHVPHTCVHEANPTLPVLLFHWHGPATDCLPEPRPTRARVGKRLADHPHRAGNGGLRDSCSASIDAMSISTLSVPAFHNPLDTALFPACNVFYPAYLMELGHTHFDLSCICFRRLRLWENAAPLLHGVSRRHHHLCSGGWRLHGLSGLDTESRD